MNAERKYGNWALIAVTMLLFGTSVAMVQYKVPVVMGDIMTKMGMDAGSASWLMSIFTFVGIILAVPTGALAKKFGPKAMLLAAAAVVALGSLVGAFAGSGTVLIVSRAIEGVAFIFVTICGPLAVQKYVAPEKVGSATGIWALWVCLGSVLGGVLTPTLYAMTGFTGVWVIYAGIAVVFAIFVAILVKSPAAALDAAAEAAADKPEEKASYSELFKPNTLLFYFAFLVFNSPRRSCNSAVSTRRCPVLSVRSPCCSRLYRPPCSVHCPTRWGAASRFIWWRSRSWAPARFFCSRKRDR